MPRTHRPLLKSSRQSRDKTRRLIKQPKTKLAEASESPKPPASAELKARPSTPLTDRTARELLIEKLQENTAEVGPSPDPGRETSHEDAVASKKGVGNENLGENNQDQNNLKIIGVPGEDEESSDGREIILKNGEETDTDDGLI